MTRAQYDRLRSAFFNWATAEGYSVGNDECGYNDDEPKAAAIWKGWLAAALPQPAGRQEPGVRKADSVREAQVLSDERIDSLFGPSRWIARRKMDKSAYEVVRATNDDWQECIEDHEWIADFKTFEEAQTCCRRFHVRATLCQALANVETAPQADAVAFDPWEARERADAAFSPQAIAAAPIATCKTSGMGLCEAREEGGSFCPGGRCLRYDAAPSPQPGPGELSDEQIDEALFDELGWESVNGNKGWHVDGGWLLKSDLRIAIRSILSLAKQPAVQAHKP